MSIRVFYFTGILGSGKTSFIDKTLGDLAEGQKPVVLCLEAGDEDFTAKDVPVVYADSLKAETIREIAENYRPDLIFIEDDGSRGTSIEELFSVLPEDMALVQFVCMINAQSFARYMQKAPVQLMDKIRQASMVVFNRCTDELAEFIRDQNLRMVNRSAEFWLEFEDGHVENIIREGESYFDLDGGMLTIEDDEFPVWYTEALDYPERFEGMTVNLNLMVDKSFTDRKYDILGLWIMTCCENDVQFFPVACKKGMLKGYADEDFVNVTAIVRRAEWEPYMGEGPVLEIIDSKKIDPPALG